MPVRVVHKVPPACKCNNCIRENLGLGYVALVVENAGSGRVANFSLGT